MVRGMPGIIQLTANSGTISARNSTPSAASSPNTVNASSINASGIATRAATRDADSRFMVTPRTVSHASANVWTQLSGSLPADSPFFRSAAMVT